MKVTTKTLIAGILALGLVFAQSAHAAFVPVLLYDADNGTSNGTPSTLAAGTAIPDQSGAGNNGSVVNDNNGAAGAGAVDTVEDDPFNVAGELSYSFDGSKGRIVSDAIDLLSDDAIAAAGGYTMSGYVKTALGGGTISLLTYAGTDGFTVAGGNLTVTHIRGNAGLTGPAIGDDTWHSFELQVDTSADPDGTANSTPGGPSGGVHGLEGVASLFVDGALVASGNLAIGDFGDSLDRPIGVGGHTNGFNTTEFTGLLYNPAVSLGVPEPSTMLLALGAIGAFACGRRR